ncbi:MAG: hypothetical protein ACFCA4_13425 [Cyanophyceae cyanobacterium]
MLLRLWNLGGKPPSSIEISSIGFGLGQGFADLPLDRPVPPSDLLISLQFLPALGIGDAIARLAEQSNHPPLFFALMRLWLGAVTPSGAVVDLSMARLFSVLLGVMTIPVGFWIAHRLGRSLISPEGTETRQGQQLWFAHGVAALLAFSPYGIAIAQEARHYTLAVLWALGTWTATLLSAQRLQRGQSPGWKLGVIWVVGNTLALATHYLSLLGIVAQGMAIAIFAVVEIRSKGWPILRSPPWRFMALIALAQAMLTALWLPTIAGLSSNELTTWIQDDLSWDELLLVPLRLLLWMITMVFLLPVEGQPTAIIIPSALGLLVLLGIVIQNIAPIWISGLRPRSGEWAIWGILAVGAIAPPLMMIAIAQTGRGDLSLAPRYQFVHFVPVVLIFGLALGRIAGSRAVTAIARWSIPGRRLVIGLILTSFLGGFFVAAGAGFQKSRQLDRLWSGIYDVSGDTPTLLVTEIETYSEVRGTVAISYEWQRKWQRQTEAPPQLLMLQSANNRDGDQTPLAQALTDYQGEREKAPLNLWTIDFSPKLDLQERGCEKQKLPRTLRKTGYKLRHYRCAVPRDF